MSESHDWREHLQIVVEYGYENHGGPSARVYIEDVREVLDALKTAEAKLAMYEAASEIVFGEHIAHFPWPFEGWQVRLLGKDALFTGTRDEAIAKAFELSKGGK